MKTKVISTVRNPIEIGKEKLDQFILEKSLIWEGSVKESIRDKGLVDVGTLLNSYYTEITDNGFFGISSATHAKYVEFGAEPHWVPFHDKSGKPILANWARRVLKMSKEEMEAQGGMVVQMPEHAPMRRALARL